MSLESKEPMCKRFLRIVFMAQGRKIWEVVVYLFVSPSCILQGNIGKSRFTALNVDNSKLGIIIMTEHPSGLMIHHVGAVPKYSHRVYMHGHKGAVI